MVAANEAVVGTRHRVARRVGTELAVTKTAEATKADAQTPVAVGFGIGTPEQAAQVGRIADGVIIGSRLVRAAGEGGSPHGAADAVASFLSETRVALAG